MIYGYDNLVKIFKKLATKDNLSHGYIFFGESGIGKATFARCLANFMEFGEFAESNHVFTECLNIKPDFKDSDGSIGIDAVRDIKQFLYALPVNSKRRIVLIQDAEALTAQAQNAILKIAEEPPKSGLLIMVVANPDSLIATLQSRFQKIYFPRLSTETVKKFLLNEMKVNEKEAVHTAALSFGRIGRAKNIISNIELNNINKEVGKFLKSGSYQKDLIKKMIEPDNKRELGIFLNELVANLYSDIDKNYSLLKAVTNRLTLMGQFSLNKRLQLEASLIWTT